MRGSNFGLSEPALAPDFALGWRGIWRTKVSRRLTTRWSGPGIRRQKQELIEMSVTGLRREGAIPGRSARSRYASTRIGECPSG